MKTEFQANFNMSEGGKIEAMINKELENFSESLMSLT